MSEQWVVNASPLILLARIGREDLLRLLPRRVVIPQAVVILAKQLGLITSAAESDPLAAKCGLSN